MKSQRTIALSATSIPTPSNGVRYIAGDVECRECGHRELIVRDVSRVEGSAWQYEAGLEQCPACESYEVSVPLWLPVTADNPQVLEFAILQRTKRLQIPRWRGES